MNGARGGPEPVVDVIVVTWNDEERITIALDSVFALSEARETPGYLNVIVSDNGSADGTRELITERYGARVTIIENGENLGFAAGVNRALDAGSAPYVFLLNPDAQLKDRAIANSVAFLEGRPDAMIAGSRIYNPDGTVAESCGEFDSWTGAFLRSSAWGNLPLLKRFANGAKIRDWGHSDERKVDLAIGAAICIRRSLFRIVGPFDERFFLYHEEVDLAKRAAAMGYETWYVPSSEAVHVGMGSSPDRASAERHKQLSRRKYWVKHHGRLWYLSLCVALVARYGLYLGLFAAVIGLLKRPGKRS